jgi:hypothetical protein
VHRHLLGKKSWNVYNQDNINKVRRDEAAGQLREKEEQCRVDKADAEARLRTLRGIQDINRAEQVETLADSQSRQRQRPSKKRRLDGEDDTDRDIRLAQQLQTLQSVKTIPNAKTAEVTSLLDKGGHINLFPDNAVRKSKGNDEVAAEDAKRQQALEDQYTLRFANAAGKLKGSDKPWYTGPATDGLPDSGAVPKNVWGIEDPRRKAREQKRLNANDPLAAMKKGVKQLREADKHREEWRAQRERDLNEVEELARKLDSRRKRRHSDEESLDGFDLDEGYDKDRSERRRLKSESGRHHRRHRDGSRSHKRHRSRS